MTDDPDHPEHDEHDELDQPDELRDQVRAADPASSLAPADPTWVARLLEDTMADELTDESRADGTHHRSRLTWLVAAAAAVLMATGVTFALVQEDDAGPASAGDQPAPAATQTVTDLTVSGDAASAKCLVPASAPQVVTAQTLVFDGTVESISGNTVTLAPTRFYTGEETDLVTVQAPSEDMQFLLSAVTFREGERYLVAATDGRVTLCGFSDVYSDELAGIYEDAFSG